VARRRLKTLVAGGAALAGLTLAASAYFAHRITSPRRIMPIAAHEIAPEVEDITFRTGDGLTIHGWYLPHDAPRDAIVIAHGFAMNRVELLDLARGLRARGHAILLFDFRAHGASEGTRSTIGYHEAHDVAAGAHFLHERPELAGRAVGALGLSMGAVATIFATAEEPLIAAVVADSAYATLGAVAVGGLRLLYRLPAFPFAPLVVRFCELFTRTRIGVVSAVATIGAIAPRPLLLIHGEADRLIPVANAHDLYAAAREPKELWLIPGIDHARAFHHAQEEYLRRLDAFFTAALAPACVATA
jgi:fermentation-respiration switch protein FrsA (DUF1100 family)